MRDDELRHQALTLALAYYRNTDMLPDEDRIIAVAEKFYKFLNKANL